MAGGWKQLFINKSQALRKSAPWVTPGKPCFNCYCRHCRALLSLDGRTVDVCCLDTHLGNYEVSALIESMRNPSGKSLGVIFLVDGSGSVSEPDFNTMTTFVKDAVVQLDKDHEELHVVSYNLAMRFGWNWNSVSWIMSGSRPWYVELSHYIIYSEQKGAVELTLGTVHRLIPWCV